MDKLKVPVSLITENGLEIAVEMSGAELQPEGTPDSTISAVSLTGRFFEVCREYLFKGKLSGRYCHDCDRCLAPVRRSFETEVLWSFVEGPPRAAPQDLSEGVKESAEEACASYKFQGHEIDLAPYAWEEAVLAEPGKFLCQEDCAGLCPVCGVNRNLEKCACVAEQEHGKFANKGLATLAEMFPDLKNEKSED
ncbi:MAG: DUF177 domain-containing protein [Candidatus Hydrogenedentes bacterium]|nr:DUF177 domain-containing protein [Candidatus Hydrogenedentota bacterium]